MRWIGFVLLWNAVCVSSSQTPDHDRLIGLARKAITAEVSHTLLPRIAEHSQPKPVFVTIESGGKILGCRGDLVARTKSLEEEIILTARNAAAHDPRYTPVRVEQLKSFQVTVTIVDHLEPITGVSGLDPSEGLVLESGESKGIVLPWEGKDPRIRLQWAYKKAGVSPGTPAKLYKLFAERFKG